MNGKRIVALLLVFALCFVMVVGCGKAETDTDAAENDAETTVENEETQPSDTDESVQIGDIKVEVVSCMFDNELVGIDEEISTWGFQKIEGKVYVNLALKIFNNGTEPFTEDDIKAYFEYDELRYDMQYELEVAIPTSYYDDEEVIPAGSVGIVYLFDRVEEAAMSSDITVHYTIGENQYERAVDSLDPRTPFEKKIKVSAGDVLDAGGIFDIEVISCKETKVLRAQNYEESKQYTPSKGKYIDFVVKIKNNFKKDLTGFSGYVVVGDVVHRAEYIIETDNNTDLREDVLLKSGEENIMHVYAVVDEDVDTDGLSMRINLLENCYYCEVE